VTAWAYVVWLILAEYGLQYLGFVFLLYEAAPNSDAFVSDDLSHSVRERLCPHSLLTLLEIATDFQVSPHVEELAYSGRVSTSRLMSLGMWAEVRWVVAIHLHLMLVALTLFLTSFSIRVAIAASAGALMSHEHRAATAVVTA